MKFITYFIINTRFSEVKRPGRALGGFLQTPQEGESDERDQFELAEGPGPVIF